MKAKILLAVLALFFLFSNNAHSNIFTVTLNTDTGTGSLREAIMSANTIPGYDSIYFNIGGNSVADRTITVTTDLPSITEAVMIDGTTQTNGKSFGVSQSKIILDGVTKSIAQGIRIISSPISGRNTEIYGLYITRFQQGVNITGDLYDRCIIGKGQKGNVLSNNSNFGIYISGADSTYIAGNIIGLDTSGTVKEANGTGVYNITTALATIIGGAGDEGNIISGNGSYGVRTNSSSTIIKGNKLGTDVTAAIALGNSTALYIESSGSAIIGGNSPAERNIISGNGSYGVYIASSNNTITGNFIGTDATGQTAVPNSTGIYIASGSNNTIGASNQSLRNIISGNNSYGVYLSASNISVIGNYIGTNVDGTSAVPNGIGIYASTGTNVIIGGTSPDRRNLISGNNNQGVVVAGSGIRVIGNYIGTNLTGMSALPNQNGVYATSSGMEVGGSNAGEGNLISGNRALGILANTGSVIKGNIVGLNASGTDTLGNGSYGIQVNGNNTTIGGATPTERNIISGNKNSGIFTQYPNTIIKGNFIGTDISGTIAFGNAKSGIYCNDDFLVVGGNTPGERNIISGNGEHGIHIINSGTTQAIIKGNYIGVDVAGLNSMGNSGRGIFLSNADRATIGGILAGEGNIIANNGQEGIYISGTPAVRNRISGNSIYCNSTISGTGGIFLISNGNSNKAAPVIDTATTGKVEGSAAANNTIEIFYNGDCAYCEGKTFIASVTSDSSGRWSYTGSLLRNRSVSATATDSIGNTSRFSACKSVFGINDVPVALPDLASYTPNSSVMIDILNNDSFGNDGPSNGPITVTIPATYGSATVDNNNTTNDPTDDRIVYTPQPNYTGSDTFIYKICDFDNDCDTALVIVQALITSALQLPYTNNFNIFPNPTSGNSLTIITGNFIKPAEYAIINSSGQRLLQGQIVSGNTDIDLSDLSPGIYFVKVKESVECFIKLQ